MPLHNAGFFRSWKFACRAPESILAYSVSPFLPFSWASWGERSVEEKKKNRRTDKEKEMQNSGCECGSAKLLQVVPAIPFPSLVSSELGLKKNPSPSATAFCTAAPVSGKEAELSSKTQVLLSRTKLHGGNQALTMALHGSNESKLWHAFNWFVSSHCDRIPLGFSCSSLEDFRGEFDDGGNTEAASDARIRQNNEMTAVDAKKRVLILMSDTGGGHRASAEAIKATFELEYGDKYQVFLSDGSLVFLKFGFIVGCPQNFRYS